MEIPKLENVIAAYECWNSPYDPKNKNKCEHCPYGYGYYDTTGDNYFWACSDWKWEEDAYFYLKLYQHLVETCQLTMKKAIEPPSQSIQAEGPYTEEDFKKM
jgi:hypothetical protein